MKKLAHQIVFVLLLFLMVGSNLNAQILLKEVSLKRQIENSSLVVEGKVLSKKSFWGNDGIIYTANTIGVYKVFKGELLKTIAVITSGGMVGLRGLNVSNSLKLREGDIGVFMLQETIKMNSSAKKFINKQFKSYGGVQGFYKYNIYEDVASNPFNAKKGISNIFYNEIIKLTKEPYKEIVKYDVSSITSKTKQSKQIQAPTAITFSPTIIRAGTKSTITITLAGGASGNFGTIQGKVSFSDADLGEGGNYIDALDSQVTSWSSTSITVEVPSSAGTGKIRVINSDTSDIVSTTDLTVIYSEINVEYDSGAGLKAYQLQHVNDNGSGGYTWEMQTDFFNDTEHVGAKAAFLRAFNNWVCNTGINWTIKSTPTTVDVIGIADSVAPFDGELDPDTTNIIRFDNGDELSADNLGVCYSWYRGCPSDATFNWYVYKLDIVFNDDINSPDTPDNESWNFSTTPPSTSEYDFESVALHELGHGHQLGHVIDTNDVMNYDLLDEEEQRVLGSGNITAATTIQSRSTTTNPCPSLGTSLMTNHPCYLSVEEEELKDAVSIYPNPSKGSFNVKNTSLINLEKVVIYDISGRLISEYNMTNSSRIKTINLVGVSKGMYFINIHSKRGRITKKLILE
jgi:hypothetical protein